MAAARAQDDRKAERAHFLPRFKALEQMAWHALVLDHHGIAASAAVRRASLARDRVFQSLPERARLGWEEVIDEVTDRVLEGSGQAARETIRSLAEHQASAGALVSWSPPADAEFDPVADVAAIPRG
jgi:hypothetical protein